MNNYLVTFFSTHHALKAEKLLKMVSFLSILIPVPREINAECGFCLLLKDFRKEPSMFMKSIKYDRIYKINYDDKGNKSYEKTD